MMPKAVFFDWDGTLVDSIGLVHAAHNHVRLHYGLAPWSVEDARGNIRLSSREIYPVWFGADRADEAIRILYQYYDAHSADNVRLMPGFHQLLQGLRAAGIVCGVVSNRRHENLVKEVATLAVGEYFGAVIGAGYAAKDKPAPDPLLAALAMVDIKPQDSWYVGDTDVDMECAAAAGAAGIFIEHGMGSRDKVAAFKPLHYVKDLADLKGYIV